VHGLCLWENTNGTKNFIYSSLSFRRSEQDEVDVMCVFNYVIGNKIRRLSMNVAFKYIWPKRLNFLTYRRIVHKV
jgi:hypothetical protein